MSSKKSILSKPVVKVAYECLCVAESNYHLNNEDKYRREALIGFNIAIKKSIVAYLSLDPQIRGGEKYPEDSIKRWKNSFRKALKFFFTEIVQKRDLKMAYTLEEIRPYRNVRNKYEHPESHPKSAIEVPSLSALKNIRGFAIEVFAILFKCPDINRCLERDVPKPVQTSALGGVSNIHNLHSQLNAEQKLALSAVAIVGGWDESNSHDIEIVKKLLDKFSVSYDVFLKHIESVIQLENTPLEPNADRWTIKDRLQLIKQISSTLFDKHLNIFKECAIDVLKEINLDLLGHSPEKCYQDGISIYGNTSTYSPILRESIAEFLAIIGNIDNPKHCSPQKAKDITCLTVREVFRGSDWRLWASLDDLLPILAEAYPKEFIESVKNALETSPCPFDKLFPQEEADVMSWGGYMAGLLSGLEKLAWHDKYIMRTVLVLGELSTHDPRQNEGNRPIDSISTLLLPWCPQTNAGVTKRIGCVKALRADYPDIAWKVALTLLPNQHQSSSGTSKPRWFNPLPENHQISVTDEEYWEQAKAYSNIAVKMASEKTERLAELAGHLDNLVPEAFNKAIETLSQEQIVSLAEDERLPIWNKLTDFVEKHRALPDVGESPDEEFLTKIDGVRDLLKPTSAQGIALRMFNENRELYEKESDLKEQRIKSVKNIIQKDGIDGLIGFVQKVKNPSALGQALAEIGDEQTDQHIIPQMLLSESQKDRIFSGDYVYYKSSHQGCEWLESIFSNEWSAEQKLALLFAVPADPYVWGGLEDFLGEDQNQYWKEIHINPHHVNDLDLVIPKLLKAKRGMSVVDCLHVKLMKGKEGEIDSDIAKQALMTAVAESQISGGMYYRPATELIKHLQSRDDLPEDDLCEIECTYLLPWLSGHNSQFQPKILLRKLTTNPKFFSKVISTRCALADEDTNPTDYSETMISKAGKLLDTWKYPPGLNDDGSFDGEFFSKWYEDVVRICTGSGHLEVAQFRIGKALFYTPPDSDGFWINKHVAKTLNDINNEALREGFTSEPRSTGVVQTDPTGQTDLNRAKEWSKRVDELEAEGMAHFATELRTIPRFYEHNAQITQSMYKQ